jgi:hypothetical protein
MQDAFLAGLNKFFILETNKYSNLHHVWVSYIKSFLQLIFVMNEMTHKHGRFHVDYTYFIIRGFILVTTNFFNKQ